MFATNSTTPHFLALNTLVNEMTNRFSLKLPVASARSGYEQTVSMHCVASIIGGELLMSVNLPAHFSGDTALENRIVAIVNDDIETVNAAAIPAFEEMNRVIQARFPNGILINGGEYIPR